ncbi:hypothetical protein BT67DRAFT_151029 [Trichocladium antarcticum]|uniref:Uncharacterized protein n=1 Tax=Trichocladium antarcticum TaxID=1450529 RepID=A0AAN6ZBX4_9PEZI|nr:hypothetical protein BT67DRAFT_151029 [Trichocladium antarcticum]
MGGGGMAGVRRPSGPQQDWPVGMEMPRRALIRSGRDGGWPSTAIRRDLDGPCSVPSMIWAVRMLALNLWHSRLGRTRVRRHRPAVVIWPWSNFLVSPGSGQSSSMSAFPCVCRGSLRPPPQQACVCMSMRVRMMAEESMWHWMKHTDIPRHPCSPPLWPLPWRWIRVRGLYDPDHLEQSASTSAAHAHQPSRWQEIRRALSEASPSTTAGATIGNWTSVRRVRVVSPCRQR